MGAKAPWPFAVVGWTLAFVGRYPLRVGLVLGGALGLLLAR